MASATSSAHPFCAKTTLIMFAIQYALIICNAVSCLPALPAIIHAVDSDKFHTGMEKFFATMPNAQDQPLLKLMMKFQFGALSMVYVLGIFAGIYCPTVLVGYMFATGNVVRIAYFLFQMYGDATRWAMAGFNAQQLNKILILQALLGAAMFACTYISSANADYQAFVGTMADSAAAKMDTDRAYIIFICSVNGFFMLTTLPGILAPGFAIKNYITVEAKLPVDKGANTVMEFTMGFQQLALFLQLGFGIVMLYAAPSIDVIALFWCLASAFYVTTVFFYNILNAEAYGFDRMPMLVFLTLNVFTAGVSFMALFY